MALTTVLSESIRPERLGAFEERVRRLAERAAAQKERFHWTTHVATYGALGWVHFVSEAESWAALAARGTPEELVARVMGEKEGRKFVEELRECVQAARQTISVERPDLSYAPDPPRRTQPMALVTTIRVRPGGQEALEELVRKIAEAIPKAGDPATLVTYQTIVGDLRQYWTVRPVADAKQLDAQLQPANLLVKAFGASEGGLLFRTGQEAIEQLERQLVVYRADLSNPG